MSAVITRQEQARQFCTDAGGIRSENARVDAERAEMPQQIFSWSTNSFIMLAGSP